MCGEFEATPWPSVYPNFISSHILRREQKTSCGYFSLTSKPQTPLLTISIDKYPFPSWRVPIGINLEERWRDGGDSVMHMQVFSHSCIGNKQSWNNHKNTKSKMGALVKYFSRMQPRSHEIPPSFNASKSIDIGWS